MRLNYKTYPTDYIQQLKMKRGVRGRKKARAFMEYWDDMEHGDHNSIRFYATSWEISSSTAHSWINEFDKEIDLFLAHWSIKNRQHYNYAQSQAEQQPNETNTHKTQYLGELKEGTEHQPNKVFNIYNNKDQVNFFDKDFEDMYLRCRFSCKFTGNKELAYQEYIKNHLHISYNDMAYAYMLHANDPRINGKTYNLTNFMKQQAYLNYLNPQIKIKKDGKLIVGYYDQEKSTVITDDNIKYTISKERFTKMLALGEIIITKKMRVA